MAFSQLLKPADPARQLSYRYLEESSTADIM